MNADPADQLRLLDLQGVDTALAQLAHRRANLPELARLVDAERRAAELGTEVVDAQTRLADVAVDQKRLEAEIDQVRARESRDEQRLQAGGLPAKELESLQHELATLARRQGTLEDDLLEVMEQAEAVEADVARLSARREEVLAERSALEQARDTAFDEIDAASADRTGRRATAAGEIPAELLALYEKARAAGGGVGAAMLRQRRCEGCHIELSGSELSAVRSAAPDAVLRCENCRRILVRTAESGL